MYFKLLGILMIYSFVIIYVGKIKVQNKELLSHGGTAQFLCTLIFAGSLLSVILFHVGFFHKTGYTLSPMQKEGLYLLVFFIVSANIIYWLYQIRNKNLHALAQYIAEVFLIGLFCVLLHIAV